MPNYNKCILIGYMVADPEMKTTPNGKSVTAFTIGVTRKYKVGGENVSDFFPVVAWDKVAETVCKYFKKGSCIIVTGSLQTRTYDDSSGQKRKITEVFAESVEFGESKNASNGNTTYRPDISGGGKKEKAPHYEEIEPDDGLPF